MLIRALTVLSLLVVSQPAFADTTRVLVVVEAAQGPRVGAAVRRGLLAQVGDRITLAEAGRADVVITVTATEHAVSVRYWDTTGSADAISLPLPNATARVEDVASTLGAVLLQRHGFTEKDPSGADVERAVDERVTCKTCALAAARPWARRTFALALSDFQ